MELTKEEIIQLNCFLQMAKSVTEEEKVLKALNLLVSPTNKYLDALSLFGRRETAALAMSFINISKDDLLEKFDCQVVLMGAIYTGSQEVVELMLSKGIDITYILDDESNVSLLGFAVIEKQMEIVKFLLKQGADVNASCSNGATVLNFAVLRGDVNIIKVLLDSGANVHVKDDAGRSLLHHVIIASELPRFKVDRQKVFKLLLEQGVDVNGRDNMGLTPLHLAIDKKCNELVKLLLNTAASIEEVENECQMTPLLFAVITENTEIVKLLLAKGANVSAKNNKGNTVLHFAVKGKNEELVKILLDHGANFNKVNDEGLSSFHVADTKNIIEMLLSFGADINSRITALDFNGSTALGLAAYLGHEEQVQTLINNGAEVEAQDQLGNIPLFDAVCQGHSSIVKILLDAGASINFKKDGYRFNSLYYFAASKGHKEILELLLKHDVDVNAKCTAGDCPAILAAAREGHQEIVEILLFHGANITVRLIRDVTGLGLNDIAKTFVKELVRRKFVDSHAIGDNILDCIKEFELLETFLTDCESELEKINETFPGTTVTYKSVLKMRVHDLAAVVANENILNAINFDDFLDLKFPVYGSIIVECILMGVTRKKLLDQLARFFNCLYDNQDEKLPQIIPECSKKIFQYLDAEDLKTLAGVFTTSKKI